MSKLALFAICLGLSISSGAAANTPGQVVLRENVSPAHRAELINQLRKITGWTSLKFTDDGTLFIDNSQSRDAIGGSKSARNLLTRAIGGKDVIVVEDASGRADVAFCRVVPGRWISGNYAKPPAYVVLIDFTDFEQIVGDNEARASFDVGWGFLHELDHVVTDSDDSEVDDAIGECESHINQMREELGLPVRSSYFFTLGPKSDADFNTRFVRLPFERRDASSKRIKRYWLTWDSNAVGGFDRANRALSLR